MSTERPLRYMWLEESGFSVPGTPFLYRSKCLLIRLRPHSHLNTRPRKKELPSVALGVHWLRSAKAAGLAQGQPTLPLLRSLPGNTLFLLGPS